jgi:hypothetical protein
MLGCLYPRDVAATEVQITKDLSFVSLTVGGSITG